MISRGVLYPILFCMIIMVHNRRTKQEDTEQAGSRSGDTLYLVAFILCAIKLKTATELRNSTAL